MLCVVFGMNVMPKRILRYAIAGSLAIHVIAAHFVRPPAVSAASEPPPTKIVVIHIVPPKPKVTPTPPPPKPEVHHTVTHTPPRAPHLTFHTNTNGKPADRRIAQTTPGPGDNSGLQPDYPVTEPGTPGPPVTPLPVTPATPACTAPDAAAHVLSAITPDTPELARQEGLTGVTEVRVDLAADGNVEAVSVYRSSGSTLLDAAALRAAKASRYAAASHACENQSGSYIFKAEFDN